MASSHNETALNDFPLQDVVLILVPVANGTFYRMHKLGVPTWGTDAALLSRIRKFASQNSMRTELPHWFKRILVMQRLAMGRAQVLGSIPPETQTVRVEYVHKIKEDEPMTKLINNEAVPLPSPGHLKAYMINNAQHSREGHEQIWCMYYKLDGAMALMWVFLALTISFIAGIATGFSCEDGKLGLQVGTGVFTVLSAIQAVITLYE